MNEFVPVTRHRVGGHSTWRSIIKTEISQNHARDDGLEMRRLIRCGCKLRHTGPRPPVHADIYVRPGLLRREFDSVSAVLAILNAEKIKWRPLRAAGGTRIDTHHRVSLRHERPVQIERECDIVLEVRSAAD